MAAGCHDLRRVPSVAHGTTPGRVRGSTLEQVTDGPAVESAEQLGGYYLLNCKDLDQALELAAKIPGASYGTHVLQAAAELSLAVGGRRHG